MAKSDPKPSVSSSYAFVIALAVLLLIASYVTYETYVEHTRQMTRQMETEATRLDRALILEIEHSSHLLQAIGQQMTRMDIDDLNSIAVLLRTYDTTATVHHVFSWIDANGNNVVSTNKGVHKPVDVSDRDFVKKCLATPWKIVVGNPIQGRVSGKWALPVAIGITDATGKYVGTLLISMDIYTITSDLERAVKDSGIAFIVYSSTGISPLTQNTGEDKLTRLDGYSSRLKSVDLHQHASGIISSANPFFKNSMSVYYELSSYPYVILMGIDNAASTEGLMDLLLPRLLEVVLFGAVFITLFGLVKLRIIQPVTELSAVAGGLLRGEPYRDPIDKSGVSELHTLSQQIKRLSDYLRELRLIEEENKSKNVLLKNSKEASELSNRIKIEFLRAMSYDLRTPLNSIIGFSEMMKAGEKFDGKHVRQYAEDIHKAAKQLQSLVGDMQKLPKLEASSSDLQEKHIDIRFILSKATRLIATRLAENKLNIELKLPETLPHLLMDEDRLEQIIISSIIHVTEGHLADSHIVIRAYKEQELKGHEMFCLSFTDSRQTGKQAENLPLQEKILAKLDNVYAGIPLTKALTSMFQIQFDVKTGPGKPASIILRFPKDRFSY